MTDRPPRQLERLDLLSLRLFLAVVDLGSLAEVGRTHFIAPTAVTKRMQELEDEFGVQLLYRTPKGVSPTSAGEALARHVRNMNNLAERMRTEMTEYAAGARGHVRLVANASALVEYLADELAAFRRAQPEIQIDLRESNSEHVVRAVRDGNADLGIFAPPVSMPPELEVYPYALDELVAAVPEHHPLAARADVDFAELRQHPLIGVDDAASLSHLLAQESRGDAAPGFRVQTNDVARWMVSRGLGITILPSGLITPYEAALKIRAVKLRDAWASRTLMLCVRDSARMPAAVRGLFDALLRRQRGGEPAGPNPG